MKPASMRRRAATLAALALCMCLGTTSFSTPSFASAPRPPAAVTDPVDGGGAEIPPAASLLPDAAPEPDHVRASALPVDERGSGPRVRRGAQAGLRPACGRVRHRCRRLRSGGLHLAYRQRPRPAASSASTTECVNTLFGLTGENARLAFREASDGAVATHYATSRAPYSERDRRQPVALYLEGEPSAAVATSRSSALRPAEWL
ncbi:hypothetical protein SMICM17S_03225 [Streptomyces microflavus]